MGGKKNIHFLSQELISLSSLMWQSMNSCELSDGSPTMKMLHDQKRKQHLKQCVSLKTGMHVKWVVLQAKGIVWKTFMHYTFTMAFHYRALTSMLLICAVLPTQLYANFPPPHLPYKSNAFSALIHFRTQCDMPF